jgi:adenine-specific DNA-methyltransferase
MPTLNWIGKDKIINHHQDVPYKVLNHEYGFSETEKSENAIDSGNLIINGDNLEALKSLLPKYEGKINCIYIDPPYNTGNENWVYNDNVNSPKIKKWFGKIVGKENEDLTRDDKWLCMMYPRLKLLHKLLAKDGAIFISIDDNEQANLKLIMDEIFGGRNFVTTIHWKRSESQNNNSNLLSVVGEFIICFIKNKDGKTFNKIDLQETAIKEYRYSDQTGKFRRGTIVDNSRGKHLLEVTSPDGKTKTIKSIRSRDFFDEKIKQNMIYWTATGTPYLKLYLEKSGGQISSNWFDKEGVNEDASEELTQMNLNFPFSKPFSLVEKIITISTDSNSIILDSFAGSGTTAHAVLNLNKQDGGNRKFILIEMEDYAETITAERVKRVIKGYGENDKSVEGTGGSFDYYTLGEPLLDENNNLNENISVEKIREYVWFTETRSPLNPKEGTSQLTPFMGNHNDTGYYFIYDKDNLTTLDYEVLAEYVQQKAERYIIYADNCLLPESFLREKNIEFKKIPRDITRF